MSSSLHAVFDILFGNVYSVIVIFIIPRRKMRFSGSSQNSLSENSIFVYFEVNFLNVLIFPRVGVVISC